MFRDHGERYIQIYKPSIDKIKLIRAIRVCKSPALGGKLIECKTCGVRKVMYLSCGHSQCPLCQNHKRNVWQNKVSKKLLNVPYVHTVFTIPHELNRLARYNERLIYGITLRAAWRSVKQLSAENKNVGGLPGMITVLHTFGSDMKYHIHVHALISFGGIEKNGSWIWPKRRKKLAPFRAMCRTYRSCFIKMLDKALYEGKVDPVVGMAEMLETISNKRWNVRNGHPTMDTSIIERYLARYINRVAISKSRLSYVKHQEKLKSEVQIIYKDYRHQKKGSAAPKALKSMNPLIAIDKIMMHVLPSYLQKSRHYGLHAHQTWNKYKDKIADKVKRNKSTVGHLFALIKALLQLEVVACEKCGGVNFSFSPIVSNRQWIFRYISLPNMRAPPLFKTGTRQLP